MEGAAAAFEQHRRTSFRHRSGWMHEAAALLEADQEELARLMTTEMGKTVRSARGEVAKCARGCRYYARPRRGAAGRRTGRARRSRRDGRLCRGTNRWVWYWPSCPGTSRCGRWYALPPRHSWRATLGCSSMPQTCRKRRCTSRISSGGAGFPEGSFQTLLIGSSPGRARGPRPAGWPPSPLPAPARRRRGRRCRRRDGQAERPRARRQRRLRRHAERRPRSGGRGGDARPAARTTASPASRPSASSSTRRSPTSSSGDSSRT